MTLRWLALLGCGVLVSSLGVVEATAAPCVGAGYDKPFPGATDVETRFADVPSPRFPGLWQEGRISGYAYRIYANGEATIEPPGEDPAWVISVLCAPGAENCSETVEGAPPQAARRLSVQMGRCFTAPDTVAATTIKPEPVSIAPETDGWALTPPPQPPFSADDAVEEDPGSPVSPCGLASVAEGEPGITLQRLLVVAGANPGPLDGLPGARTRGALVQILGDQAADLEPAEAVIALDAFLCD